MPTFEDPIDTSRLPQPKVGLEEVLEPMPFDQNPPELDFEKINDEAPSDAEPFVEPEEAPKNDPVEEPE